MKILYIPLNEYDTLRELQLTFKFNIVSNGEERVLVNSKTEAKVKLYELGKGTATRVFYWEEGTFDEVTTFQMFEALFD